MSARKWLAVTMTVALSGALHAAVLGRLAPESAAQPDIAAGGAGAIPLLGDSFADMVAGAALSAVPTEADPNVATVPSLPIVPVMAPMAPIAPSALATIQPTIATAASAPPDVQEAPAIQSPAPPKDAKPAKRPRPKEPGNADRNSNAGSDQGENAGTAKSAKASGKTARGDGGTAAAAGYGSKVLKKIGATRKAKAPAKGRVVVGFVIAGNGGLKSVKIVKSSGSAALDKVALDHIRRAAPFPAPPPSAQTQFSFEFLGSR